MKKERTRLKSLPNAKIVSARKRLTLAATQALPNYASTYVALHTISDGFVMIYLYIETERDTRETACDFYKQQGRGKKVIEEKDSGTPLTRQ